MNHVTAIGTIHDDFREAVVHLNDWHSRKNDCRYGSEEYDDINLSVGIS
jgi:hypothetical protein